MSLQTTRSNRCCICPVGQVCNSPCVHQFHPVPFDLCLPKNRHKEWAKESNHELPKQSQRDEHRRAHLVAFVSSFTLRRTHTAFVSQDHKLVQWRWKHTCLSILYLCRLIVPFLLCHRGLPVNRKTYIRIITTARRKVTNERVANIWKWKILSCSQLHISLPTLVYF